MKYQPQRPAQPGATPPMGMMPEGQPMMGMAQPPMPPTMGQGQPMPPPTMGGGIMAPPPVPGGQEPMAAGAAPPVAPMRMARALSGRDARRR